MIGGLIYPIQALLPTFSIWVTMSPTVLVANGFRFFFFSREESRQHIHVLSGDGEAKFWLKPQIELAKNYGYSRKQLRDIERLIEVHYDEFIYAWRQHFEC